MSKLNKNETSRAQNSKTRACVFIDSSDPLYPNQVINGSNHPCFKPPFPPTINPRDLVTKQSSNGKIMARAPNAFIIYRKLCVETARSHGYYLPMTVISSMTSQSWEEESSDVKAEYKRIAQEANKYHREMYPKTGRRKKREKWNLVSFQPKSHLQEGSLEDTNDKLTKITTSLTLPSSLSELSPNFSPSSDTSIQSPTNTTNGILKEIPINSGINKSNDSEINPAGNKMYPSPDTTPDNYQEVFSSKNMERFQPPEGITSSQFNLEYPSPNLSSDRFFDLGNLNTSTNIYEEDISNWHSQSLPHNMSQGRIISDRGDVNYESNNLENSNVNNVNVNNVNTSEGFNLADNLNISFSVMMGSNSYFDV